MSNVINMLKECLRTDNIYNQLIEDLLVLLAA